MFGDLDRQSIRATVKSMPTAMAIPSGRLNIIRGRRRNSHFEFRKSAIIDNAIRKAYNPSSNPLTAQNAVIGHIRNSGPVNHKYLVLWPLK